MQLHYHSDRPISYDMLLGDNVVRLNDLLGEKIQLEYLASIKCQHCGRKTSKSFNQGYCFPCFRSLARCDVCIVKPELCHFHKNTCREPEWGQAHCMIRHTVYLANSSGLKVGVTRSHQQLTRWMDQGAVEALPLVTVESRLLAGKIEVYLKKTIADKTNWRQMLKGEVPDIDLHEEAARVKKLLPKELAFELSHDELTKIQYPVLEYPTKISSFNFDKTPKVAGKLMGLKGQYLILDTGVINIRKFAGYEVRLQA